MSEFCDNCPLRGSANGELVGHYWSALGYKTFGGQGFNGQAGVFIDKNGGLSEVIALPSTEEGRDGLQAAIGTCEGPTMKEKGIFKKREVPKFCPAIGRLAIIHPQAKEIIHNAALIETASVPHQLKKVLEHKQAQG